MDLFNDKLEIKTQNGGTTHKRINLECL